LFPIEGRNTEENLTGVDLSKQIQLRQNFILQRMKEESKTTLIGGYMISHLAK
jgi:hypothetical protein